MKNKLLLALMLFAMLASCASNKPYGPITGGIVVADEKPDVETMAKAMKAAAVKHGWRIMPPDDKEDVIHLKLEVMRARKAELELEVSILDGYYQYECISYSKVNKSTYSRWVANLDKTSHKNIADGVGKGSKGNESEGNEDVSNED